MVTMATCGGKSSSARHLALTQLNDGGAVFTIYHDKLCGGYDLQSYPANLTMNDFSVEKLSKEQFCKVFVSTR